MRLSVLLTTSLAAVILSACGASSVHPTVAPNATPMVEPTSTPLPTATPTVSPTPTSTPTLAPTPTPDIRVVSVNPLKMIIEKSDLPKDGMFILAYSKPYRNEESAANNGIEKGTEYIAKSGRVDGWHLEYDRTVRASRQPEYFAIAAILFRTAAGPIYSTGTLSKPCVSDDNRTSIADPDLHLADKSYLCLWKKMQSGGQYYIEYSAVILYRNVITEVYAGGYEDTFDPGTVVDVAKLQAAKVQALPLADTVTWSP